MDFLNAVDTVPFNTQPWPEYLNRKAKYYGQISNFILAPPLTCSSVLDLTAHTDTNVILKKKHSEQYESVSSTDGVFRVMVLQIKGLF